MEWMVLNVLDMQLCGAARADHDCKRNNDRDVDVRLDEGSEVWVR